MPERVCACGCKALFTPFVDGNADYKQGHWSRINTPSGLKGVRNVKTAQPLSASELSFDLQAEQAAMRIRWNSGAEQRKPQKAAEKTTATERRKLAAQAYLDSRAQGASVAEARTAATQCRATALTALSPLLEHIQSEVIDIQTWSSISS